MPIRFSFSGERKTGERKSCKGDAPLTPSAGRDTTTAWGSSGEDSVQAAQRGQVRARTVKHSAANFPWLPLEGKLRPQAVMRCRFRLRNRFQTKKQLYVSQRAIALHLIRPSGTFPSKGKAKSARRIRAARTADERFLPEYGNFLRCAQHLCCLALPACPFPGGLGGREPVRRSPLSVLSCADSA